MSLDRKKGQMTVFIILAIIIVLIVVVLAYFYAPSLGLGNLFVTQEPEEALQDCVKTTLDESVEEVSMKGGYLDPEFFYLYKDEKYPYLCYTNEYHKLCVVQQPMLYNQVAGEINTLVEKKVRECFSKIKTNYEKKGYTITYGALKSEVNLQLDKVVINTTSNLKIEKDTVKNYNNFAMEFDTKIYDLVSIAQNIIEWEATYGDSESLNYMELYPDIKVEKIKMGEGTTIYILTHRETNEKFKFASRSIAWPAGFGG